MNTSLQTAYDKSISQLEQGIQQSSEEVYRSTIAGRPLWQQCLHALMGSYFWFRLDGGPFTEPFAEQGYEPEFAQEPRNVMPKAELLAFLNQVKERASVFFTHEDFWFEQANVIYPSYTNQDVALMQVRHMMYHVGYLSACLQESPLQQGIPWQ